VTVPGHPENLTGRDHQSAELLRLLELSRLVTLTGPAGTGKSALAVHVAERLTGRPAVLEVDRLGTTGANPPGHIVADAIAAGPRPVLVLDGCEGAPGTARRLTESLLGSVPSLRIVAASRETLGVPGESVVAVPPLAVPEPGRALVDGERSEAVRLFFTRAVAAQPTFTLGNGREEESGALVRALGGIPLAIEKAAVLASRVPLRELRVRAQADPLGLLTTGHDTGHPRHRSMLASIGWSHQLCEPAERLLWARLSVFSGPISNDAAVRVCSDAHLPAADVPTLLARLAARSVLSVEEHGYQLPPLHREYGRRWLHSLGEAPAILRRYVSY
jgi:predicted ATPase